MRCDNKEEFKSRFIVDDYLTQPYVYIGGMITVMSPEGKPMQVAANALQAGGAGQLAGRISITKLLEIAKLPRIVNNAWI